MFRITIHTSTDRPIQTHVLHAESVRNHIHTYRKAYPTERIEIHKKLWLPLQDEQGNPYPSDTVFMIDMNGSITATTPMEPIPV